MHFTVRVAQLIIYAIVGGKVFTYAGESEREGARVLFTCALPDESVRIRSLHGSTQNRESAC